MTCKDCLHVKVCDNLIAHGLPFEDGKYPAEKFCDLYKSSADVVEVVRCKDCKHCVKYKCKNDACYSFTICRRDGYMVDVEENDFCSYGERKEQDNV